MNQRNVVLVLLLCGLIGGRARGSDFQLTTFSADVTIPIGHRCMGVLETKAKRVLDPLLARGLVILGAD